MKTLATKLTSVELALAKQRGLFHLFALLLPEEARLPDLIFVAAWADRLPKLEAIGLMVEALRESLGEVSLLEFSRVLTFPVKTPGLAKIYRDFPTNHQLREITNEMILDLDIRKGYLITAQANPIEGRKLLAVS